MILLAALDRALSAVGRAERRGLLTRSGAPAEPDLARLRTALMEVRERARTGDGLDREAFAATIRDVAAWTPDTELELLAALGAVAQAARL